MHPELIKAELRRRFGKQKVFARRIGITPGTLSAAINGTRPARPTREKVAKALNVSYKKLWNEEDAA